MKIGAYIEVAIVAFPYKFCRMINILLDEDRETGAAFRRSFWEYWERKSRVWQYLEGWEGDAVDPPPQRLQSATKSGRCIEV